MKLIRLMLYCLVGSFKPYSSSYAREKNSKAAAASRSINIRKVNIIHLWEILNVRMNF